MQKTGVNYSKHGITFEEAQTAFDDVNAIMIFDPDHSIDEDRFLLLGLSRYFRMLVVCHCYRANETEIRIISARKATPREIIAYQKGI